MSVISEREEDLDWFDQDEEEIFEKFNTKINAMKENTERNTEIEFIKIPATSVPKQDQFKFPCSEHGQHKRLSTAKLRQILEMEPNRAFLSIATADEDSCWGFSTQITATDSMEHVCLYLQVLARLVALELPGYQRCIVTAFVTNEILLQRLLELCEKLSQKATQKLWTDKEVDAFIQSVDVLCRLVHQQQTNRSSSLVHQTLKDMIGFLRKRDLDSPLGTKVHFLQSLLSILEADKEGYATKQFWPSLNELLEPAPNAIIDSVVPEGSNSLYLRKQLQYLRGDFLAPLRDCMKSLRDYPKMQHKGVTVFEHVSLVLQVFEEQENPKELLCITFKDCCLNEEQQGNQENILTQLHSFKPGSLLCLTSSQDLKDLLLVTVAHTPKSWLNLGYLHIEILQQENLGNILSRKYILLESPAYIEAYRHVYNVLKTNLIADYVPMTDYIIKGKSCISVPSYLATNVKYRHKNKPKDLTLDASQCQAFENALSQEFCLIQGPPGTGKTQVSVDIVRKLIEYAHPTPIMLITYTNESLDKFLLQLTSQTNGDAIDIGRLGFQTRNSAIVAHNLKSLSEVTPNSEVAQLKRLHYESNLQQRQKFDRLLKLYREFDGTEEEYQRILIAELELEQGRERLHSLRALFQYEAVRGKQIVGMTTSYAAKHRVLLNLLKSSIVIFEEAAEILESHALACLTRHTKHIIMLGDYMQLKPYTASVHYSRAELNVSLFERLIQRGMPVSLLCIQYRMRPEIAEIFCPIMYEGNVKNAPVVAQYPNVKGMSKNLYFLTHSKPESNEKNLFSLSKFNEYECHQLLHLARHLIETNSDNTNIVILSPYAAQVQHMTRALKSIPLLRRLQIATVDSFQGLEADIVLLSLVRSNENDDIGFLAEKNRICTALSRAKLGLYMIGNMQLLAKSSITWQHISRKLEEMEAIGAHFPIVSL